MSTPSSDANTCATMGLPYQVLDADYVTTPLPGSLSVMNLDDPSVASPPKKKPRLASARPMTSNERNKKSLQKLHSLIEEARRYQEANMPVPPHLQEAVNRDNMRKAKKAESRKKRGNKATLSPPSQLSAGPSQDAPPCRPSPSLNPLENIIEKEMNELKSQLAAANLQATIYQGDHGKEMNELKSQLNTANQQATTYRKDYEEAMDMLKLQQQAQEQAVNQQRHHEEEMNAQLASAIQLASLVQKYEEEMQKLKSSLAIAKQFAPSLQKSQEEAKKLKLQLEEANQEVSRVKGIFNHEDIKCGICYEVRRQPASLTCAHSFCASCLLDYFKTQRENGKEYECPICRIVTNIAVEDTDLKALTEKIALLLCGSSPPATGFNFRRFQQILQSTIYVNSQWH